MSVLFLGLGTIAVVYLTLFIASWFNERQEQKTMKIA
jgi:hypothetical protein